METERIDLGDGCWWEIRTVLTRRMEKAITRATMAGLSKLQSGKLHNESEIKTELYSNLGAVDLPAIEDIYLLYGTVAYSFGDKVDLSRIDELDSMLVRRVLTRMYELYGGQRLSESEREDFFVKSSNVS